MDTYKPIDCDIHDVLEDAAVRERLVEITFDNGVQHETLETKIVNFITEDDAEYVVLEHNYMRIRLDKIVSIDGKLLADGTSIVV